MLRTSPGISLKNIHDSLDMSHLLGQKMGWVLPMLIWPEIRIRQCRVDDHREDASHFRTSVEPEGRNLAENAVFGVGFKI